MTFLGGMARTSVTGAQWQGLDSASHPLMFPDPGLSLGAGSIPGQGCSKSRPHAVLGLSQEPGRKMGNERRFSILVT